MKQKSAGDTLDVYAFRRDELMRLKSGLPANRVQPWFEVDERVDEMKALKDAALWLDASRRVASGGHKRAQLLFVKFRIRADPRAGVNSIGRVVWMASSILWCLGPPARIRV